MATLNSTNYQAAFSRRLAKEVLPVVYRDITLDQFADKKKMEKGAGVAWTATRFNRVALPQAPLSEGVQPTGNILQISQVTGVALQWGDKITLSDVAVTTTMYDLLQQAKRMLGISIKELRERNGFAILMGATQVNYVAQAGSRSALTAGNVLDTTTINRTYSNLRNEGAFPWNGSASDTNPRSGPETGPRTSEMGPMRAPHYAAICSPLVTNDLRQNSTLVLAWSYSDVTRLYNNEVGYFGGIHFTESNMVPHWTGVASVTGTGQTTGGALANATYALQVTATDTLNQFGESLVYQVQTGVTVGGSGAGSITLTAPSTAGYTYNVYISAAGSTTITNLALATATGVPTSGLYSGQAVQIAPGASVTVTAIGLFQIPPAAPTTGVTVYPTFVFGREYFAQTMLEDISYTFLGDADKSDPLNQLRVVGYKFFEGYLILNQQFGCRIESSVSNTGTFG